MIRIKTPIPRHEQDIWARLDAKDAEIERLRTQLVTDINAETEIDRLETEIERLRALILDACDVFAHYDLPEHAFHYRRELGRKE
jgi:hypothetical protein